MKRLKNANPDRQLYGIFDEPECPENDAPGDPAITRVVNILLRDHYDVYVGRVGKGHDGYFGNPFRSSSRSKEARAANIAAFRDYFEKRLRVDAEFKRRVLLLKGKRLGCFCAPADCHADIVAEYLNSGSEDV